MADTKLSDLSSATAATNLSIYVVDPDESTAADRSKKITIDSIFNAVVTHDGEIVVYNGNIVLGEG